MKLASMIIITWLAEKQQQQQDGTATTLRPARGHQI